MLIEFLKSFLLIFTAEIGDKTQILALSFSLSYSIKEIFYGFLVGSIISQGLAVLAGQILQIYIPSTYLYYMSAVIFLFFGFLNIVKFSENPGRKNINVKNIVLLIALTFFLVELGDKTQLSALAVASKSNFPFFNLLGGTSSILSVSVIFILMSRKLGSKLPERSIKIASSFIFIIIGIVNLTYALPTFITEGLIYLIVIFGIIGVYIMISIKFYKQTKFGNNSLRKSSNELYNYYNKLSNYIDEICLGSETCGNCMEESCIIGYTKNIIKDIIYDKDIKEKNIKEFYPSLKKNFNNERVYASLSIIIGFLNDHPEYTNEELSVLNKTRNNLEMILFGKNFKFKNIDYYLEHINSADKKAVKKIKFYLDKKTF
ncbi:MAG: TMEM165/GDT1 family protein [Bacillota bacterium]|nr:TMEM165/GDT1 family protein [Bacillota bacterium]